jgi:hypothetical protein
MPRIYGKLAAACVLALVALAVCAPLASAVGSDWDSDGIRNASDNCTKQPNPTQTDLDGDGKGDACDPDRDGDGQLDADDPCPEDALDGCVTPPPPLPDADGDGIEDSLDNCPNTANANQADLDGDGVGDACDPVNDTAVYNVKSYGATGDGSKDDSAAFQNAMNAARDSGGGKVYVPGGTYKVADVRLRNNVTLQIDGAATIQKAAGGSYNDIFHFYGANDTTFLTNAHIVGVNGNFTLDMSNSPSTGTNGIFVRNVKGGSVQNVDCLQNDSNTSMLAPTSRAPCVMYRGTPAAPVDRVKNVPTDFLLKNAHSFDSPFGFGLTQVTAGQNLEFQNISGDGGVALRMETDGAYTWGLSDVTANDVRCTNGHAPVHTVPWSSQNGVVKITNVRSVGCEEGLSLLGDNRQPQGVGTFNPDPVVDGVTVVPGPNAQLRTPDTSDDPGSWYTGPSRWCVLRSSNMNYSPLVSNIDCGGLPNHSY